MKIKLTLSFRGAALTGRWSHDGAGIVTGGEDGAVKIWSRSGMLRSTLAHNTMPVYALAWSPDSSQVRFKYHMQGGMNYIMPYPRVIQEIVF